MHSMDPIKHYKLCLNKFELNFRRTIPQVKTN